MPSLEYKNPATARGWRSYYADKAVVELVAARYRNDLLHFEYENINQELLRGSR